MDILNYAIQKNTRDSVTCYRGLDIDTTAWTNGTYNSWQNNGSHFLSRYPWCNNSWNCIPRLLACNSTTSFAGCNFATGQEHTGFKVCANNLYGGACCLWTVPSGSSVVRFQVWGAGAGSGSGCCCGGSIHGTSGAYASIIVPVTPGCQYTLCAGCACATPILWTARSTNAPSSFVTGQGLSNFCAMGGRGVHHWCIKGYDVGAYAWIANGMCRWGGVGYSTAGSGGACICNAGGDFCFATSCASCGPICYSASVNTLYYGSYTGSVTCSSKWCTVFGAVAAGLQGLNGAHCFDTNFYGCYIAPPIYGFENVSRCILCHTDGNTSGGLRCNHVGYDYARFPGAGGTPVALFGGCVATTDPSGNFSGTGICGGDIGRSGMVCVTFA